MPIPAFYQYGQGCTADLHCLSFREKKKEQSGHHWRSEEGIFQQMSNVTETIPFLFTSSLYANHNIGFTCNPGHMGRIGTREPVRRNKVVQAKGIKPNLKGAKVQVAVRTLVSS